MTAASPAVDGAPATTADVRNRVRDAAASHRTLRITGGATWLDANRPVSADAALTTAGLKGIVEYVPGDLTLTARAGTTLDEIARAAAENRQWLALDPSGDPARATLGATIATGSYGPLAHHFGTARDMTLGVEFVTGTGDIVRGGGRVVKNVAGFDLTRLLIGSWGTLGVITEVSVRLRAVPAVESTLILHLPPGSERVEAMRAALRRLPFVPLAAQLLSSSLARIISGEAPGAMLLLRIGGNAEAVSAQRRQLGALGRVSEMPMSSWTTLRAADPVEAAVVRLSRAPSRFAETWRDALALVDPASGFCQGDPGRGVVRCVLPLAGENSLRELDRWLRAPYSGTRIVEQLPRALWPLVPFGGANERLSREVKRAFDPAHLLNPGILGFDS